MWQAKDNEGVLGRDANMVLSFSQRICDPGGVVVSARVIVGRYGFDGK